MSDPTDPKPEMPIPRGIEVLVKKAAVDAEFRRLLLSKRAEAAAQIGLDLDASERMMLSAVPEAQLETIIDRTRVPEEHRRVFLGKVAAAMLAAVAAGGTVAAKGFAAGGFGSGGIMPDRPMPAPTGIRPDLPDPPDEPATRDARPEMVSRVAGVLAHHTPVPEKEITATKHLLTDLKIDAAAAADVCRRLESEFNVALSRRALGELGKVGDLAERIEAVGAVSGATLDTMAKQLQVDRGKLSGNTTLETDLAVSRLQLAQLRRRLASQFRVYLDWDEFKKLETVGDVVDLVALAVKKRTDAASAKEQPPSPVTRGIRPDRPMTFGIQPDVPPHGAAGLGGIRPGKDSK